MRMPAVPQATPFPSTNQEKVGSEHASRVCLHLQPAPCYGAAQCEKRRASPRKAHVYQGKSNPGNGLKTGWNPGATSEALTARG
jgi:hypothetical protein